MLALARRMTVTDVVVRAGVLPAGRMTGHKPGTPCRLGAAYPGGDCVRGQVQVSRIGGSLLREGFALGSCLVQVHCARMSGTPSRRLCPTPESHAVMAPAEGVTRRTVAEMTWLIYAALVICVYPVARRSPRARARRGL